MTTQRHGTAFTVTPREYYAGSGKAHRNGGFLMSTTEQTPRRTPKVKEPIAGPWDWRALLPSCTCELDDLRVRAAKASPEGINLTRFFRWLDAETIGDGRGVPSSDTTLANYRRFLFDLNVDHEPAHGLEDVQLQQQRQCAFGGVAEAAENPCSLGSVKLVAA